MAKEKLFPAPSSQDDTKTPNQRFHELASRVVRVTKAAVDEREKRWAATRKHQALRQFRRRFG
jgi:hypothetical protein